MIKLHLKLQVLHSMAFDYVILTTAKLLNCQRAKWLARMELFFVVVGVFNIRLYIIKFILILLRYKIGNVFFSNVI